MKERMQKALSISSLFFATMCLTSCEINSDTSPWQIILIIIGVLYAMLIANYKPCGRESPRFQPCG